MNDLRGDGVRDNCESELFSDAPVVVVNKDRRMTGFDGVRGFPGGIWSSQEVKESGMAFWGWVGRVCGGGVDEVRKGDGGGDELASSELTVELVVF